MKSTILNLRWRGMVAWALLAVGGGGPVGAFLLGLAQGERAQGETPAPTAAAQGRPRPTRPADDTVVVSARVLRSLGVHTTRVTEARRPRGLPSLTGTLALDTNRLARARARFAGEVVQLGTVAESDPTKPPRGTGGRLLHCGDTVRKNQLLAVVWSKDLGEKKSELVDAVSKLKLDREVLDRLRALFKEGGTSERGVREAERAVESDLIAVARAERTLRSWRLGEDEIAAVRGEAERLGR